jgi:hypothetical protein
MIAFQKAILLALFTEKSNKINLQFFLYDQVEELYFLNFVCLLKILCLILEKNF